MAALSPFGTHTRAIGPRDVGRRQCGNPFQLEAMAFSDLPPHVQAEYERIGRERAAATHRADRVRRLDLVRVCAELIAWTVVSLVVAGFAFHVSDYELGKAFLYGGMALNIGGVTFSIAAAYVRGERRGDW